MCLLRGYSDLTLGIAVHLPKADSGNETKEGTSVALFTEELFKSIFCRIRIAWLVPWMARRPRVFAAAASVFVVTLAGLQLQYLYASDFAGELGDWLGLLLWAAVVELSGVRIRCALDVFGRLGPTNVREETSRNKRSGESRSFYLSHNSSIHL